MAKPMIAALVVLTLGLAACSTPPGIRPEARAAGYQAISLAQFADGMKHWRDRHGADYAKYGDTQIVEIADNILLYQRDHGGWIENRDPTRILSEAERAAIRQEKTLAAASFDNRNIYPQIAYLAAAFLQTGDERYRAGALKGLDYTFAQQNPRCGGWPHTVPGTEPYHPHITMADEVTPGVLTMLRKVADGLGPFTWVAPAVRERAAHAVAQGDACLLRLQVVQNGRLAGWAGQYDAYTLAPAQGRSFELPSIVSQESVVVLRYLMSIPRPSPEVIRAIEGGMDWFGRARVDGVKIVTVPLAEPIRYPFHTATTDRQLVDDPAAPPLWGRFYDLADNSVILANRDGQRVARYADIQHERRTGYAWYGTWPEKLLAEDYPAWRAQWAQ